MDRRCSRRRNGKKKGKRRGWIWTCRNNGATKAVADREVRGHGNATPPPPPPQPPSPPPTLSEITPLCTGSGIAQLVQRPTENTGAVLTRVRVPGAAKVFSPRVNFQLSVPYVVRTAPVCNRWHQHLCAR